MSPTAAVPAAAKRTNVRSARATSAVALRGFFGAAERLAPSLGAVAAARIWFTVPRPPRPLREPVGLPPYRPLDVPMGGRLVRARLYGSGPRVLLVHGWGGWGLQLGALVGPLAAAGLQVITYDALSHGASDPGPHGRRSSVLEFRDAVHAVAAATSTGPHAGPLVGVVAHSLGAMAVAAAVRDGLEVGRAVLVAPSQHPAHFTVSLGELLGYGPRVRRRLVAKVEREAGLRLDDFDVAAVARSRPTPATLVIHDRADPSTPYAGAVAIADAWPGATLITTEGLGHHRVLRDPAVVGEAVGFLVERARAAS